MSAADLAAELAPAVALLESLIEDDPCQRDPNHHGCLSHGFYDLEQGEVCPMQAAKDLVAKHKPTKEGSTA